MPQPSQATPLRRPVLNGETYAEIIALSEKALGPGLAGAERDRWRFLIAEVLELLGNISPVGSERRRHLRAAAALTVELHAPIEVRGLVTSSISGGGLAIPIAQPPAVGTELVMSIHLPERPNPLRATASVVWLRQGPAAELGALFTRIDERDRDLLEALVVQRLSRIQQSGY